MDRLRCIEVFLQVATSRSFSLAAEQLEMSRGGVSKHVSWLEKALGVQLLVRTTRSVSVTDAGQALMDNGRNFLARYDDIEESVRLTVAEPKGLIRIGAPLSFGTFHMVPAIIAFSRLHPDIQVSLIHDDGTINLVERSLDFSVRISSSLRDSSFVAHRLALVPQALVASPTYLRRAGRPKTVADLAHHNCLVHSMKSPTGVWKFNGPEGLVVLRVSGTLRSTIGDALRQAALLGHGISMHAQYMLTDDLSTGKLEVVLPDYQPVVGEIHAVFPSRRNMPARVRTFLDFLKTEFQNSQEWVAPVAKNGLHKAPN